MTASSSIKTRFLIISDTHGKEFSPEAKPLKRADVAIHCGDLTDGSSLYEFHTAISLLKDIDAPLKLVIAGNHDITMDTPAFAERISQAPDHPLPDPIVKVFGTYGQARQLLEEAKDVGIMFLDEGTHYFTLENGAFLTVYASPFTPAYGGWGFQYPQERGHNYGIEKGVDVVITHGPPRGIMDYTNSKERAGSPELFAAVARVRPLLHCFGHIHEDWGAKMVTWRPKLTENPSHFTDIDNGKSYVVENLASLKQSRFDTPENLEVKLKKMERYSHDRCCTTSHCTGDKNPLQRGVQTLFVNASITDNVHLSQKPWLIDIELPKAG